MWGPLLVPLLFVHLYHKFNDKKETNMAHRKIISALNDIMFTGPIHVKTMTLDERAMFLSDRFYEMKAGEISEHQLICDLESIDSILN